MAPEPETVIDLLDSSWFYVNIFKNQPNPPISEPNPNPQITQIPTKLHVPRPLTSRARSKSEQLPITNRLAGTNPNPHLETIRSEREVNLVEPPRFRRGPARKKNRFSKSMSELEFEEMKGLMDLGFVFSETDKEDSNLVEIVPGLQKLGRGVEEVSEPPRERRRPYLSEAWEVERPPAVKWRLPEAGNEVDMKDNLRWWAHTVVSAVR